MDMIKNSGFSLERAGQYKKMNIPLIPAEQRPSFHACSPIGWMNDPNGFSEFQGEYHLMYQHNPYDRVWGPMHWGHCKSKDFIRWEQLPDALAPDQPYDQKGCFSGSAIEHEGKHVLLYTGVVEGEDEQGEHYVRQTQCIAIGDGVNYEKLDSNPVINTNMLPKGSSKEDFRDPKIWKDENTFYAVVGSRNEDGTGQILMYSSKNLREWIFSGVLEKCEKRYGLMWECPDFFSLDGKQVLVMSPQNMLAEGLEFHSGHGTLYMLGKFDKEQCRFEKETVKAIDYGLDFYAPQTMETSDGRRIMVAWMQSWDNHITPEEFIWSGIMTIPRELQVINGRLYQLPVREIELYYKNQVSYNNVCVNDLLELKGISGRQFDMTVEAGEGSYDSFQIYLAKNDKHHSLINYNLRKNTITFDRNYSGLRRDTIYKRSMYVANKKGKIKLRILMDKYSVEIFVNDGEQAMSSLVYTSLDADRIIFSAEGYVHINVMKYDIIVE